MARVASCIVAVLIAAAAAAPLAWSQPADTNDTVVCLAGSPRLVDALTRRQRATMTQEANAIWAPFSVRLQWHEAIECHTRITVKSQDDTAVRPPHGAGALGWVPFVSGQARPAIFLDLARTAALARPLGRARGLAAADHHQALLLGRVLAHELGHVLLDQREHGDTGLMRPQYVAADALSPAASYTLAPEERARLADRLPPARVRGGR